MADRPEDITTQQGEILFYQTEDGQTRVECRFEQESLWLTQALMAELFQVTVPTVNEHLKGIYADGELEPQATIRKFRIVAKNGPKEMQQAAYPQDSVVRFSRTTAAGKHVCATATWNGPRTCKQNLQVQHEHARQEYARIAQRRREHKEALGEAESIKALEDAAKQIKKPGDGE